MGVRAAAGRVERLFYCGSCFVRGVGCVQLRGGLAALREVAPCLFARWVAAVRWQLHPRTQSLRLMALRCCCCCLDVDDSIAGFTNCDRSVTFPFFAVRGWINGIPSKPSLPSFCTPFAQPCAIVNAALPLNLSLIFASGSLTV